MRSCSGLRVGIAFADVPDTILAQHFLRIVPAAEAGAAVWPQVGVHRGDRFAAVVAVCKSLAARAERFASHRGTRMTVGLDRDVEVAAVARLMFETGCVEHLPQPTDRNQLNGGLRSHAL